LVALLEGLASQSVMVPGTTPIRASRDWKDVKFLAAGLEGEAEYVVTGDKDLLAFETYQKLRIVTPAVFLRILGKHSRS
jgi:predicted nucleic acid-binding protein